MRFGTCILRTVGALSILMASVATLDAQGACQSANGLARREIERFLRNALDAQFRADHGLNGKTMQDSRLLVDRTDAATCANLNAKFADNEPRVYYALGGIYLSAVASELVDKAGAMHISEGRTLLVLDKKGDLVYLPGQPPNIPVPTKSGGDTTRHR